MKIAVFGAGGIGGYFGGRLAQAGADVHLIARGAHLQALRQQGLQVRSGRGDIDLRLPATDEPAEIGPSDLVLFCVKSYDTLSAAQDLAPLYRTGPNAQFTAVYPHAGPLLTRRLNVELISEHWDDLLRLAASVKFGHTTASLIVGKLSASDRQNTLAAALKEYGALRRTIYAARYLADETYRRRIARQLNKGESIHALRRGLYYAHEGAVRRRHLEQQTEQAWCLTLVTNAIICWTTEYYGLAVAALRADGHNVDDALLAHISPARSENVNFFGSITVDVERELAKLDDGGYRPLRTRTRQPDPASGP